MKINITIEIDDKELKGLFEEEKPKIKTVEYKPNLEKLGRFWSEEIARKVWHSMCILADKYGRISLIDYQDLLVGMDLLTVRYIPIEDNDVGWDFETIYNEVKIVKCDCGWRLTLPEPKPLK